MNSVIRDNLLHQADRAPWALVLGSLWCPVANPDKKVINIAGVGSFHMNCNELSTWQNTIPMMELVVDNSVLGMVRQWQKLFYDNRFSQTTQDKKTDFVKLAEAFGVKAFEIHTKDELIPVLKEALGLKSLFWLLVIFIVILTYCQWFLPVLLQKNQYWKCKKERSP